MDKATLFKAKAESVEIDGVGTVQVAYPKHRDLMAWMEDPEGDSKSIAACLVDPALTVEEANDLPVNVRTALTESILRLSGFAVDPTNG